MAGAKDRRRKTNAMELDGAACEKFANRGAG